MSRWKRLRGFYTIAALACAFVATSCADSKETINSSFDMSEYRKMMERQKNEQAALESAETTAPKLTPEEQERAGDAEAQRRNFPMAGLHYTKALNADPARNSVRLKLGQMMLQQGMFDAAVTQFQDATDSRTQFGARLPGYRSGLLAARAS